MDTVSVPIEMYKLLSAIGHDYYEDMRGVIKAAALLGDEKSLDEFETLTRWESWDSALDLEPPF